MSGTIGVVDPLLNLDMELNIQSISLNCKKLQNGVLQSESLQILVDVVWILNHDILMHQ